MTKKEMVALLEERGNWSMLHLSNGPNGIVSATFLYEPTEEEKQKRFPIPGYCCEIFSDESFRFTYAHFKSGNVLSSPKCSPVTNKEHFERIQMQFEQNAAALAKYGM
ncbi:MAG: hypothetical protein ACI4HI_18470 [Lachnospiraceae bacterium]